MAEFMFSAMNAPEQHGEALAESHREAPPPVREEKAERYFQGRAGFFAALAVLVVGFGAPLFHWARFAAGSELYSFSLLMPFVSLYLVWLKKRSLLIESRPARGWGMVMLGGGCAVLAAYWMVTRTAGKLTEEDRLAFTTFSFFLCFSGVCFLFLGRETLRGLAFPLAILVFIVPLPTQVIGSIETFLQNGSAAVAEGLFNLSGAVFSRNGLLFQLPGIRIQVAPECSGLHSSLVLLIVSLIAGHLFLRSVKARVALAAAVLPLALLRNGFRIFTIGQLCVHLGPQMIDSPIHRRGGPLFFAASLIPFLALLLFLQKIERGKAKRSGVSAEKPNA